MQTHREERDRFKRPHPSPRLPRRVRSNIFIKVIDFRVAPAPTNITTIRWCSSREPWSRETETSYHRIGVSTKRRLLTFFDRLTIRSSGLKYTVRPKREIPTTVGRVLHDAEHRWQVSRLNGSTELICHHGIVSIRLCYEWVSKKSYNHILDSSDFLFIFKIHSTKYKIIWTKIVGWICYATSYTIYKER